MALAGSDLSLMLDAQGAAHIAYTAGSTILENSLRHACSEDGAFDIEVSRLEVPGSTSLGFEALRSFASCTTTTGTPRSRSTPFGAKGGAWSQEIVEVVDEGLETTLEAQRDIFYTTVRDGAWREPELSSNGPGYHSGLSLVLSLLSRWGRRAARTSPIRGAIAS